MSQEKPAWVEAQEQQKAAAAAAENQKSTYTPAGKGSDYYMNNTDGKGTSMSASDQAALKAAGDAYNSATTDAEREAAHAAAEEIRNKYGYSGGRDGSEYIPTAKQPTQTAPTPSYTAPAPDFTGLLDSWLETAKQQQNLGIDYATQKGVNDLQRAEEDAQEQFQTQQNQVDENEAKALDNQALYAEARGDRGGIGHAQYGQIQATAMENRRAINSARTKLSTDTARAIADLRAQGEFKKADALLQLTQTYLGQLIDLQKWGAEYSLNVAQFNAQLQQWQAEFELESQKFTESLNQWDTEFKYAVSQDERNALAKSGAAALSVGVRPSAAQQAAMGYTDAQVNAELAAYKLALASGSGGGGGTGGGKGSGGGAQDYEGLYKAALASGQNIKAFIANNYKRFGFTSSTGLADGYEEWVATYEEPRVPTKNITSIEVDRDEGTITWGNEVFEFSESRMGHFAESLNAALETGKLSESGLTKIVNTLKVYGIELGIE